MDSMSQPENLVNGFNVERIKSFYHFNGAYAGRLDGTVNLETITSAIKEFSPMVSVPDLNIAVVDYDTSVFFFAVDSTCPSFNSLLNRSITRDNVVTYAEPNSTRSKKAFLPETKSVYIFNGNYDTIIVEKNVPNFNSHGLIITVDLINEMEITLESPTGHLVHFKMYK